MNAVTIDPREQKYARRKRVNQAWERMLGFFGKNLG